MSKLHIRIVLSLLDLLFFALVHGEAESCHTSDCIANMEDADEFALGANVGLLQVSLNKEIDIHSHVHDHIDKEDADWLAKNWSEFDAVMPNSSHFGKLHLQELDDDQLSDHQMHLQLALLQEDPCITGADGNVCQNNGSPTGTLASDGATSGCSCTCTTGYGGRNCQSQMQQHYQCVTDKIYLADTTPEDMSATVTSGIETQEECAARCDNTPDCKVYIHNTQKACYLKSTWARTISDATGHGTVSCYKASVWKEGEYNCENDRTYYALTDEEYLFASPSGIGSRAQCARDCDSTTGCVVFVHNKHGACYLKDRWAETRADDPVRETVSCYKARRCHTGAGGNICQNGGTTTGTIAVDEGFYNCGCACKTGYSGANCEFASHYQCVANKEYYADTTPEMIATSRTSGVVTQAQCAKLCDSTPDCKVYVHNKFAACYLKSKWVRTADVAIEHETVSCYKAVVWISERYHCEHDRKYVALTHPEFLGGSSSSGVVSQERCASTCDGTASCKIYVYNKDGACYLLGDWGETRPEDPASETVSCSRPIACTTGADGKACQNGGAAHGFTAVDGKGFAERCSCRCRAGYDGLNCERSRHAKDQKNSNGGTSSDKSAATPTYTFGPVAVLPALCGNYTCPLFKMSKGDHIPCKAWCDVETCCESPLGPGPEMLAASHTWLDHFKRHQTLAFVYAILNYFHEWAWPKE